MTLQDGRIRFGQLLRAEDYPGMRRLLADFPPLLLDQECRADMMIRAAMHCHSPWLVAILHSFGIPLDIVSTRDPMQRPLYAAASPGRWHTMRWLVEHGAEVNWEVPGREPYCVPLPTVIRAGHLDTVRLLVEACGRLDVCDRRNRTPLDWAVAYNQPAIADYLRSRGCLTAPQTKNYVPPLPETPVLQYMADRFGRVSPAGWRAVVPDPVEVAVYGVRHDDFTGAFTDGLSARPMVVPPGKERYRFAELAVPLGPGWPDDPKDWGGDEHSWVVQWLRQIANYPTSAETWLDDPHFVLVNGDPPTPLSPYTRMAGWLGLVDQGPLEGFRRPDGTEVVFYTLHALHPAEIAFEQEYGLRPLLERFSASNAPMSLDPKRSSIV